MAGAGEGLRDVRGRQEPPLALGEGVGVGVEAAVRRRLLRRPRRQQRDLVHHVLHLVAERRLGRRRQLGAPGVPVAVAAQLRQALETVAGVARLALVPGLDDAERPPVLLVAPVALPLVDEERRLARER